MCIDNDECRKVWCQSRSATHSHITTLETVQKCNATDATDATGSNPPGPNQILVGLNDFGAPAQEACENPQGTCGRNPVGITAMRHKAPEPRRKLFGPGGARGDGPSNNTVLKYVCSNSEFLKVSMRMFQIL